MRLPRLAEILRHHKQRRLTFRAACVARLADCPGLAVIAADHQCGKGGQPLAAPAPLEGIISAQSAR